MTGESNSPLLQRRAQERAGVYRAARIALVIGLVVNLLLGLVKGSAGFAVQSFALLADSLNSAGDVLVSVVALVALWVAQRPANEKHPYGYARAEAVAASHVALLVLVSGLWLGVEAVRRLASEHEPPPLWALGIAAANVLIKEVLYRYKRGLARRLDSRLMLAAAWDHRSDALSSLAVLAGLAAVRWWGPAASFADEAAALVVVLFLVTASVLLLRGSWLELLDRRVSSSQMQAIRDTAAATDDVGLIEKLRVRKVGLEQLVDIHVQVDPSLCIRTAHTVGHRVKDRILEQHPTVRDVLVHVEPLSEDGSQDRGPDD